jgi:MYXO-CTERM domain-containing protein
MTFARSLLLAVALVLVAQSEAAAHMKLTYPPDRIVTNGTGDPQKGAGPCANGTATGVRTQLKAGQEIMVQWTETISHPGHFRIAFDVDGTDDFKDPTSGTDIVEPAAGPILADGLFKMGHMGGRKLMYSVKLPNVVCKTCTLQVLQIMTDNEDVIYRHCADIELTMDSGGGNADGGSRPDAGSRADAGSRGDAGSRPDAGPPPGSGGAGGSGGSGGAPIGGSGGGGAPTGSGGSAPPGGSAGAGGSGGSGGSGGQQPMPRAPSPFSFGCSVGGDEAGGSFALALFVAALVLVRRRKR